MPLIEATTGDLLQANVEALVNPVNCVGVMGRGLAAQFKAAFPENFAIYAAACARGELTPGSMLVTSTGRTSNPRWIINFPTKRHWRGKSRLDDIEDGLRALVADVRRLGIRSLAVPPLGAASAAWTGRRSARASNAPSRTCRAPRSPCSFPSLEALLAVAGPGGAVDDLSGHVVRRGRRRSARAL